MQTLSIGAAGAGALLACRSQPSASTQPPPEPQKPEVQPSATQLSATQLPATQKADGQSYAPKAKPNPVVKPGEFVFAAAHLDHGHINGQCNGLTEAGATLEWVYDPDPAKVSAFVAKFPGTKVAESLDAILSDLHAAIHNALTRFGSTFLRNCNATGNAPSKKPAVSVA